MKEHAACVVFRCDFNVITTREILFCETSMKIYRGGRIHAFALVFSIRVTFVVICTCRSTLLSHYSGMKTPGTAPSSCNSLIVSMHTPVPYESLFVVLLDHGSNSWFSHTTTLVKQAFISNTLKKIYIYTLLKATQKSNGTEGNGVNDRTIPPLRSQCTRWGNILIKRAEYACTCMLIISDSALSCLRFVAKRTISETKSLWRKTSQKPLQQQKWNQLPNK